MAGMCRLMASLVVVGSYATLVSSGRVPQLLPAPQFYSKEGAAPRFEPVASGYVPLGRTEISVPILMYHYIDALPKNYDRVTYNLTVTPTNFRQQMDYLRDNGYHAITFDDLRLYFNGVRPLPSRPVVITIDDGYRDLYTNAFPVLQAHDFTAVAYIVTSFVNRPRYVTSDMIMAMDRAGIEIASHTVDHADIARAAAPSVTYEVVASKLWLEKLLGHPIIDFAYPSGKFNIVDEQVLERAGYSTAVTEQESTYHLWATRYAWSRTRVWGAWKLSDFIKSLGPVEPYLVGVTQPQSLS